MNRDMYLYAVLSLGLLSACSNDEAVSTNPLDYPAEIHGVIKDYVPIEDSGLTGKIWEDGEAIGVTTAAGTSNVSYVVTDDRNVKYVYDAGNDLFKVVSADNEDYNIYFKGPYTMNMTAYAPYVGERGTLAGVIEASTTSDKQSNDGQKSIDFLYATGGGSQTDPTVEFQFYHKMCQVVFTFQAEQGIEMDALTYKLENVVLDGTFDTSSGTVTTGTDMGSIDMSLAKSEAMTSDLILFPQTLTEASQLEIEMGGKTYVQSLPETEMASGNSYLFKVVITPQAMTISPATIIDWTYEEGNDHYVIADN